MPDFWLWAVRCALGVGCCLLCSVGAVFVVGLLVGSSHLREGFDGDAHLR